ncbi:hypothetical protein FA95DRAFT_1605948 [Auriscalpium vulgare]|uniref:Uncharacterized protein n=1 Tax=Auriscalpium vulgare TaxID=40419 RepID=A0ACB8RVG9_9AGAM|nr:hypothetical protein FA95DRAFT_1605948 [Auriscalpium vulgare]
MPSKFRRYSADDAERLRGVDEAAEALPKRRALVIGVQSTTLPEFQDLKGPFDDVDQYFDLLVGTYGYRMEDIVVMKDDAGVPPQYWPTHANLLRELRNLVRDAAPGDQFVLTFSGHSDQQKTTESPSQEVDGQDEVLITCDGKRIVDNDLYLILVSRLPAGSSLTAFFDSCHSGTMLDLPHQECNDIYTPWESKGNRKTNTIQNKIYRRLAQLAANDMPQLPSFTAVIQAAAREAAHVAANRAMKELRALSLDTDVPRRGRRDSIMSSIPRSESPLSMFLCNGWCKRDTVAAADAATVVSVSSCADAQRSWEGGVTLTNIVCEHLQQHPHSSYRDLMTQVQYRLHANSMALHRWTVNEKKVARAAYEASGRKGVLFTDGEMNDFQSPKLSSLFKLDIDDSIHI